MAVSGGNPTNNPNLGSNQLNGAAGAYGAGGYTPPQAPTGGKPNSAADYIAKAKSHAGGPAPAPNPVGPAPSASMAAPMPEPRPAPQPLYTGSSLPSASSDSGGGVGAGVIIGGLIVLVLLFGGMYALFNAQLSNQNAQLQSALEEVKSNSAPNLDNIKSKTIENEESVTTETLEVTGPTVEGEDEIAPDGLVINGSSNFQGPVNMGQDLSASGTVTASRFVGDGSGLTGLNIPTAPDTVANAGRATVAGSSGYADYAAAAGRANTAHYADGSGYSLVSGFANDCSYSTCLHLQSAPYASQVYQTGNVAITGIATVQGAVFEIPKDIPAGGNEHVTYLLTKQRNSDDTTTTIGAIMQTGTNALIGTPGDMSFTNLTSTGRIVFTTNSSTTALTIAANGTVAAAGNATVGGTLGVTGAVTGSSTISGTTLNGTTGINTGASAGTQRISANGDLVNIGSLSVKLNGVPGNPQVAAIDGAGVITGSAMNAATITASSSLVAGSSTLNATTGALNLAGSDPSVNSNRYAIGGKTLLYSNYDIGTGSPDGSNAKANNIYAAGVITTDSTIYADDGITTGGVGSITVGSGAEYRVAGQTTAGEVCAGEVRFFGGIAVTDPGNICGADYAEKFPSNQTVPAGEVVAIDPENPEYVVRSTIANQATAVGVVSTKPGMTVGDGNTVVALSGRVPVYVNNEGGEIKPGDYLTSSSTPGTAKKAKNGDKTIGQAMAGFSGDIGQVMMFVSLGGGPGVMPPSATVDTVVAAAQAAAEATAAVEGEQAGANETGDADATQTQSQTPTQGSGQFSDLNASGTATVNNLTVTGKATVADLEVTGTARVGTLVVNGHIVGNSDTRGTVTVPAGATTASKGFATAYSATPVVVASPTNASVKYRVSASASGLTVTLDEPADQPVTFNYLVQQ